MDLPTFSATRFAMPSIDLTDLELVEAARGQRALREQALAEAERQGQSSTRAIFEISVQFHGVLEAKLKQARKAPQSQR